MSGQSDQSDQSDLPTFEKTVEPRIPGPHEPAVAEYLRQAKRDNRRFIHWKTRSSEQHRAWSYYIHLWRGHIDPKLFEYSEKRSKGLEPPPEAHKWPRSAARAWADQKAVEKSKFALFVVMLLASSLCCLRSQARCKFICLSWKIVLFV